MTLLILFPWVVTISFYPCSRIWELEDAIKYLLLNYNCTALTMTDLTYVPASHTIPAEKRQEDGISDCLVANKRGRSKGRLRLRRRVMGGGLAGV